MKQGQVDIIVLKFKIEKFWKDLMRKTDDKPNALRAATTPGLFESLQSYATQMEKIQRSLEVFTQSLIFEILKQKKSLFIVLSPIRTISKRRD